MHISALGCIATFVLGLPLLAMHNESEKDQYEALSAYCLQKMHGRTDFMLSDGIIDQIICLGVRVWLKPVDIIKAVTEALNKNPQIDQLWLLNLPLDLTSAQQIADFCRTNTTLKQLELRQNNIGDEGCIAIASALKTNSSLVTLRIQFNLEKSSAVRTMCEMFTANTTLKHFYAFGPCIRDEDCRFMINALRENYSLTLLVCELHNTAPHLCEEIAQIQARNKMVAEHQREIIYCISLRHYLPLELMDLLITAYYNALPNPEASAMHKNCSQ